ncbi:RHS repeat-associated core domain protein (plasmid) [Thalassoporum mexicanum PCC 7367]|uniref:FG-GAP-like repeat-containing protein n=1 Tax=Thalassoporum mexicanum TaxID=3457544 RepID=UPI00029FA865|nr:FG-GAP-like repeat-containing protein [Pseudanabaena sp. PCC 7367]AFY71927.1 RHS repeat-associated core domain protein [Pseudanabaena sp. PCC 7367]
MNINAEGLQASTSSLLGYGEALDPIFDHPLDSSAIASRSITDPPSISLQSDGSGAETVIGIFSEGEWTLSTQVLNPSSTVFNSGSDSVAISSDSDPLIGAVPSPTAAIAGTQFSILAEGIVTINGGGDFDGVPTDPGDDALIYAGDGFNFNNVPILPVERDAQGNPILDGQGNEVLVPNAVVVAPGFTTANAPNNPYSGLIPPTVVSEQILDIPAFAEIRAQELDDRIAPGTTPIAFNPNQNPINNANNWNNNFPSGGTAANPIVVEVTSGINIPNGVTIENTVIIVNNGSVNFNGNGHTLNNVAIVVNNGGINLGNVQANDSAILASQSINMNNGTRFGGQSLVATGSQNSINFNGATTTTGDNDFLKVIAQGDITFNGAANTRGEFLSGGNFTFNGNSELIGGIGAKQNITFNGGATVTAADTNAPDITSDLANDTAIGGTNGDGITSDPAITGTVTDANNITGFVAGLNDTPIASYVDILAELQVDGSFNLSQTVLEQINGGPLADGVYVLHLQATDEFGNVSDSFDINFTLDTTAPAAPTIGLDPAFDTEPVGDGQTTLDLVTLTGQSEPNSQIEIVQTGQTAIADASGLFSISNVALALGANQFDIKAIDVAGNEVTITESFTRLDNTPSVSFDTASFSATEEATATDVVIPITLSDTPTADITVPITVDGTAIAGANDDFTISDSSITFTAGATGTDLTQNVTVTINPDDIPEPDETVILGFGTLPAGVELGSIDASTVTIAANDAIQGDTLTVLPGASVEVELSDILTTAVSFSLQDADGLPTGELEGDGTLIFNPTPDQIGTYQFTAVGIDQNGQEFTQNYTLNVVADPITTTRISGTILNTDEDALAGLPIELGGIQTITDSNGEFTIEVSGPLPSDTLRVLGQDFDDGSGDEYPFIAEKLELVLEHDPYIGFNNIIDRPIYLPVLDTSNAVPIIPGSGTDVTTDNIPGASVFVAADSIVDQEGNPFNGSLSITEVPRDLTPAALPEDLIPDVVVTIQPGEMNFTTPAPLTLPNRAGYEEGTEMTLWSINPITGEFDDVGVGIVQPGDEGSGSVITTVSGGIRNSSWHFLVPRPPLPAPPAPPQGPGGVGTPGNPALAQDDEANCGDAQDCSRASQPFTPEVQLYSGATIERHNLPTYQSLGQARGVSLVYDSVRADPRPIVNFGYEDVIRGSSQYQRLVADLTIKQGDFEYQVPGIADGDFGLDGGQHFWDFQTGDAVSAGLQADLSSLSSGRYEFEMSTGLLWSDDPVNNGFSGSTSTQTGSLINVNLIDSPFGSGWGMAGLQELVINPDESVLLIDGGSGELLFEGPDIFGESYVSPPGDFSTLVQLPDGTFQRTMKDQTVYTFNPDNKLASMVDRNGNATNYTYNGLGLLDKMIDPVGLETTFTYDANNKVSTIEDPSGRSTTLEYDADGNLTKIIDPDSTERSWDYDDRHHIIAETDKRNNREETYYNFAGRADYAITKDNERIEVEPFQSRVLADPTQTVDALNAPIASSLGTIEATYTDANGNTMTAFLDRRGQIVSGFDQEGNLPSIIRDEDTNLVSMEIDARGNINEYEYDANGNPITIVDSSTGYIGEDYFPSSKRFETEKVSDIATGDFNKDSVLDIVTTNTDGTSPGSVSVFISNGNGGFESKTDFGAGGSNPFLAESAVVDLNGDGNLDLVTPSSGGIKLLLGDGTGSLGTPTNIPVAGTTSYFPTLTGDFDNDNDVDIFTFYAGTGALGAILLNDGSGNFTTQEIAKSTPANFSIVTKAALGDINNDGNLDLVFTPNTSDGNKLYVRLGNGSGGFNGASTFNFGEIRPGRSLKFGDFNNDGALDVITNSGPTFSTASELTVILGNGNGGFTNAISYTPQDFNLNSSGNFDIGDINYDGNLDVVTPTSNLDDLALVLGNGDGSFSDSLIRPTSLTRINNNGTVILSDLNGDSVLDIVAVEGAPDQNGAVLLGAGLDGLRALGGESGITYDSTFSRQTSYTDELGRQTLYDIDPNNGNMRSMTRVVSGGDDVVTTYTYTSQGQTDTMTDSLGRVTDYDYDNFGNLIKITYAQGTPDEAFEMFEYDAAGNQTAMIDENGNRTEYEYDSLNRLIEITSADPDGTGPLSSPVTTFTYDANGNQRTITDPLGRLTTSDYDDMDRLIRLNDPDPDGAGPLPSPETIYGYDSHGNQTSLIDPLNRETRFVYDDRNRVIETILPDGVIERQEYDADNNVIARIDGNDHRTEMVYDLEDRPILERDPLGNETRYVYDETSQLIAQIDANGNRTEFSYDDRGRQVSTKDAEGNIFFTDYNDVGNVISERDPLGQITTYEYDNRNRTVRVIDPINGITITTYDDASNVTSITDPEGNTTSYDYDGLNRLVTETNQLGNSKTHEYDPVGNRIRSTDRNDRVREFTFDDLNRMTAEVWLDSAATPIRTAVFAYDAADQLTSTSDPDSTYTYTYDLRGRLDTSSNAGTSGSPTVIMNYDYDNASNLIRVEDSINGVQAGVTNYSYDAANRLLNIRQSGNGVENKRVEYTYDAVGQAESIKRYSDIIGSQLVAETAHTYDELNRLENISHSGAAMALTYDFTYDDNGRLTRIDNSIDGSSDFNYDDDDQLTAADYSFQADENYSYDQNGNRTNAGYQTGDNNRLESDGTYDYAYDNEGNLISKTDQISGEVTEYTWDYRNRLTGVVVKDSSNNIIQQSDYTYDVYDLRIGKSVDSDGAGAAPAAVTRFIYGMNDNIALEFDGGGTQTNRYLYSLGVDQFLADEQQAEGRVLWALTDHVGTVRDLIDSTGTQQNHITYDSFGGLTSQTDASVTTRFGFTGRELDSETGLHYYRARYFDSNNGRFISEDPLGYTAGDANLYRYVFNNPAISVDPSGLEALIYIHKNGNFVGHVSLDVNGTVYTYGRFGEQPKAASAGIGGDGYLYKVPREEYFRRIGSGGNFVGSHDTVEQWELPLTASQEQDAQSYLDDLYDQGTNERQVEDKPHIKGRRVRDYSIFTESCVTITMEALPDGPLKDALRGRNRTYGGIVFHPNDVSDALRVVPGIKRLPDNRPEPSSIGLTENDPRRRLRINAADRQREQILQNGAIRPTP